MFTSDDDRVRVQEIPELINYLDSHDPAFLSTQFFTDRLFRGRRSAGTISPRQFIECSAHAPGLVYKQATCRSLLPAVEKEVAGPFGSAYPQVLMVALLLATDERCYWWDRAMVELGEQLSSGIRDAVGERYYSPGARWRQHVQLMDFIKTYETSSPDNWRAMARAQEARLFSSVRSGMKLERPDLVAAFDTQGRRFYKGRARRLVHDLIANPQQTGYRIYGRIHRRMARRAES